MLVEHIQEVGIPAGVQLVRPVHFDAPVDKKLGQGPVKDRRPELGLTSSPTTGSAFGNRRLQSG